MGNLPANFKVEIAFNVGSGDPAEMVFGDAVTGKFGTGEFGSEYADVTEYVRSGSTSRGMNRFDGVYARAEAGRAEVVLDNRDARFDPTNLSGPYVYHGESQVTPRRRWRISADGTAIWTGFAESWDLSYPETEHDAICVLNGVDGIAIISGFDGPEQGSQGNGEDTGARINRILDSAGWAPGDRVIETGLTIVQPTTLAQPAWTEILLNADTEIGELYIDGAGRVVFRNRAALLSESRSVDSQATFGDAGVELGFADIELSFDDTQIANLIRIARAGGTEQVAQDPESQFEHQIKTFERSDLIHLTDGESLDYAEYVLTLLKDGELRFDSLTIDPLADPVDLYPQVLEREFGDRITIKLRPPGREADPITRDVYIRGIEHGFTPDSWVTRWALQDASRFDFFILDSVTLGELDDDRLAY
jgi:hypothetical protein